MNQISAGGLVAAMKPQPKPTVITPLTGDRLFSPSVTWMPVQKEQATGVVKRSKLDKAAGEKLIRSSAEILGSGVNPQTLRAQRPDSSSAMSRAARRCHSRP